MTADLSALAYLVASVCFILALRGLSHPESSRSGNLFGMVGMVRETPFPLQTGGNLPIEKLSQSQRFMFLRSRLNVQVEQYFTETSPCPPFHFQKKLQTFHHARPHQKALLVPVEVAGKHQERIARQAMHQ